MTFTKKDLENYLDLKERFDKQLEKALDLKEEATSGKKRFNGSIDDISFSGNEIKVRSTENNEYYQEVTYRYTLPISALYDDAWLKIVEEERLERESKEQKEREERETEKQEKRNRKIVLEEERERKLLEELKNKYEK